MGVRQSEGSSDQSSVQLYDWLKRASPTVLLANHHVFFVLKSSR